PGGVATFSNPEMPLTPPRHSVALALMVAAPVLWSTAGVVTRHVELATPFEMVFWRSLFACGFVAAALLVMGKLRSAGWPGLLSGAMWAVMFTAFVLALMLTDRKSTRLNSSHT